MTITTSPVTTGHVSSVPTQRFSVPTVTAVPVAVPMGTKSSNPWFPFPGDRGDLLDAPVPFGSDRCALCLGTGVVYGGTACPCLLGHVSAGEMVAWYAVEVLDGDAWQLATEGFFGVMVDEGSTWVDLQRALDTEVDNRAKADDGSSPTMWVRISATMPDRDGRALVSYTEVAPTVFRAPRER
jgi:hypothetical protein